MKWVWVLWCLVFWTNVQPQDIKNLLDRDLVRHRKGSEDMAYRQERFSVLHLLSHDSTYSFSYRKRSFVGVELDFPGPYHIKNRTLILEEFIWRSRLARMFSSKRKFRIYDTYLKSKGFLGLSLSRYRYAPIPNAPR